MQIGSFSNLGAGEDWAVDGAGDSRMACQSEVSPCFGEGEDSGSGAAADCERMQMGRTAAGVWGALLRGRGALPVLLVLVRLGGVFGLREERASVCESRRRLLGVLCTIELVQMVAQVPQTLPHPVGKLGGGVAGRA